MAKSRYQSANKELGEMYEHELEQTAEEIDATIDELITESNALMSTNDALRAELARVKAESLRVVPVPVPDHGLMYDWYMTPTGLGYPGKDRKNNNCIESAEGYYRLDECKPVRLERWEAE